MLDPTASAAMFSSLLDAIGHPRILVLGDLILDRYTWGDAERVSPEAPVLVLRVETREVRLGGAASVAMLLRGLEAQVTLAGVIGDDPEGRALQALLKEEQIDGALVIVDSTRPTTTKERFLGRSASRAAGGGHQILRVDHEARDSISPQLEERLLAAIAARISIPPLPLGAGRTSVSSVEPSESRSTCGDTGDGNGDPQNLLPTRKDAASTFPGFDAILISDYAKGVSTPRLVQTVISHTREQGIPVLIDPARITDYARYRGGTLLKPNRVEAELATGVAIGTPEDALAAAAELRERYELGSVLLTLDGDGMALVDADSSRIIPTSPRAVYDITGAGDMVLATLGLCLAGGFPVADAVPVANAAAGLEVEKLGVAPISRAELRRALECLARPLGEGRGEGEPSMPHSQCRIPNSVQKLTSPSELLPLVESYRNGGKTVVFTNGCFDLLHVGHVTCLQEAGAFGDVLIVALNSDASVRRLKGPDRPVIPEKQRAALVAALDCVDHVLIFDEPTPHQLLQTIRPDVLVKGGTTGEIIGHEVVEAYGGRVCRVGDAPGISTTQIVSRIYSHVAASQ